MTYLIATLFIFFLNIIVPLFVLITIVLTVFFVVYMIAVFLENIAIQFFEGDSGDFTNSYIPFIVSILLVLGIASKYNVWNLFKTAFEVFN